MEAEELDEGFNLRASLSSESSEMLLNRETSLSWHEIDEQGQDPDGSTSFSSISSGEPSRHFLHQGDQSTDSSRDAQNLVNEIDEALLFRRLRREHAEQLRVIEFINNGDPQAVACLSHELEILNYFKSYLECNKLASEGLYSDGLLILDSQLNFESQSSTIPFLDDELDFPLGYSMVVSPYFENGSLLDLPIGHGQNNE